MKIEDDSIDNCVIPRDLTVWTWDGSDCISYAYSGCMDDSDLFLSHRDCYERCIGSQQMMGMKMSSMKMENSDEIDEIKSDD